MSLPGWARLEVHFIKDDTVIRREVVDESSKDGLMGEREATKGLVTALEARGAKRSRFDGEVQWLSVNWGQDEFNTFERIILL